MLLPIFSRQSILENAANGDNYIYIVSESLLDYTSFKFSKLTLEKLFTC